MTNKKNLTISSNCTLRIPTREEFHRYASNIISIGDFDTNHSNTHQIDKIDAAIKWTIKHSKKKGIN